MMVHLENVQVDRATIAMRFTLWPMVMNPTAAHRLLHPIILLRCRTSSSPCSLSNFLPSAWMSAVNASRSKVSIHSSPSLRSEARLCVVAVRHIACQEKVVRWWLLDAKQAASVCPRRFLGDFVGLVVVVGGWRARTSSLPRRWRILRFYQYVEFLRGRPARGQLTSLFLDADAEPKFDAVIDSVIGQALASCVSMRSWLWDGTRQWRLLFCLWDVVWRCRVHSEALGCRLSRGQTCLQWHWKCMARGAALFRIVPKVVLSPCRQWSPAWFPCPIWRENAVSVVLLFDAAMAEQWFSARVRASSRQTS